jgi:hypothetical protein
MNKQHKKTIDANGVKSGKQIQIAVRVPPETFIELKKYALRSNQTITQVIRNELITACDYFPDYEVNDER